MKLTGIFLSITTPFDHKGDIWEIKLRHNIDKWNLTTLAGYLVCGSTGESAYLSAEEKIGLWERAAEYAAPDKLLIAGTGMEGVRETVELTNRAESLGYKVAMVRTPHSREVQMLYFRTVADQSRIPIVIVGIDIAPEDVAALSHHPNIIGIVKKSMENLELKPGFQVLAGVASTLAQSLAAGATGAVLAFANAAPYAAISIWEAHRTRETEAALDWQNRIARAAELITTKYGVPGLKHAMDLNGYYGGPPRLPSTVVGPEARQEIEQAFDGIKG
jgi:4-hydroxy-2-oxoglutarate aldolase